MKHVYRLLACLFLVFSCGSSVGSEETTDLNLNDLKKIYQSGVLSREDYVIRQIECIFNSGSKTAAAKKQNIPSFNGRALTPLIKEAVQNYMFYSDESRYVVDRFVMRPDSQGEIWPWSASIPFYLPSHVESFSPSASEYPHIGGKFTFWYVTHSQPDSGGHVHTATHSFVIEVAKAFEKSYTDFISGMGFPDPVSDSGLTDNGGDGKLDVYLMDCGYYGLYGYTTPLTESRSCSSFMVIDNDFEEFKTDSISALDSMRVTVAHEFHHTVQFSINSYADVWIMEATSCWAESAVYPDVNDNIQYLNGDDGFFALPFISLDDEDLQLYNSWIFLKYMALLWDDPVVEHVWDNLYTNDVGMDAVSQVLTDEDSSLEEAFTDFSLKNYSQTGFYPDAEEYDEVHISNTNGQILDYSSSSSHLIRKSSILLDHLAAVYYKYIPGAGLSNSRLLIEVNAATGKKIAAAVTVKGSDGNFSEHRISLNSTNDGYMYVDQFLKSTMDEVVLTVVNFSKSEENVSVSITGGLGLQSALDDQNGTGDPSRGTVTGVEADGSGGCFITSSRSGEL